MDYFGSARPQSNGNASREVSNHGQARDAVPMVTVNSPTTPEVEAPTPFPYVTPAATPSHIGSAPTRIAPQPLPSPLLPPGTSQPTTLRIRRLPSTGAYSQLGRQNPRNSENSSDGGSTRRRSTSAPQPPHSHIPGTTHHDASSVEHEPMPTVTEDQSEQQAGLETPQYNTGQDTARTGGRLRGASGAARAKIANLRRPDQPPPPPTREQEYNQQVVDLLDVVDPEVSTLHTLTNVQNSLFVPNLGRFLNRAPTYELTRRPTKIDEEATPQADIYKTLSRRRTRKDVPARFDAELHDENRPQKPQRSHSISSQLSDSHYAALPHGLSLDDWTDEDIAELDDHVRHMLHSRRERFRRGWKGFKKYISKPLGFFVTLYAVLITLFGLAWVLFLIGWIHVGDRQSYLINVIDNVLVALFAVMGDGLAPFRAVDTYHMIYIAHYHHLSWDLRKKKAMPKLQDHNDLPIYKPSDITFNTQGVPIDLESGTNTSEFSVLTPQQMAKLQHHTLKFCKSHSFYKPHETATHYAFPLRLLITIVVFLDCHSLFQIALGTCTWAISYHTRPSALTTVILCCSICINICAGLLIKYGDSKTRKKDVVRRMFIQDLTKEAISNMEKGKYKIDEADKHKHSNKLKHEGTGTSGDVGNDSEGPILHQAAEDSVSSVKKAKLKAEKHI